MSKLHKKGNLPLTRTRNSVFVNNSVQGKSALCIEYACENGQLSHLKRLLEQGADINQRNAFSGATGFVTACTEGYLEMVEFFFTTNADLTIPLFNGCTALHAAAENGHPEVVKRLLKDPRTSNVNATVEDGRTPLFLICPGTTQQHVECMRLLLEAGARTTIRTREETKTALEEVISAAADNRPIAVRNSFVALLLKQEPRDFEVQGSALYTAAEQNQPETVQLLLEAGTFVDYRFKNYTALHKAADEGNLEITKLLIGAKADVNATCDCGDTPLHIASSSGRSDVVRLLLESGAKIDAVNKANMTPLHVACRDGREEVVKILLEYKADAKALGAGGFAPLYHAALNNHRDIIRLLLPHYSEKQKEIYLIHGVTKNSEALVDLLIEDGIIITSPQKIQVPEDKRDELSPLEPYCCSLSTLYQACYKGNYEQMQQLVREIVKEHAVGNIKQEPFHVQLNQFDLSLLNSEYGNTPLHGSVFRDNVDCAAWLVEWLGISIHAENDLGVTPMELARDRGSTDCLDYFAEIMMNQLLSETPSGENTKSARKSKKGKKKRANPVAPSVKEIVAETSETLEQFTRPSRASTERAPSITVSSAAPARAQVQDDDSSQGGWEETRGKKSRTKQDKPASSSGRASSARASAESSNAGSESRRRRGSRSEPAADSTPAPASSRSQKKAAHNPESMSWADAVARERKSDAPPSLPRRTADAPWAAVTAVKSAGPPGGSGPGRSSSTAAEGAPAKPTPASSLQPAAAATKASTASDPEVAHPQRLGSVAVPSSKPEKVVSSASAPTTTSSADSARSSRAQRKLEFSEVSSGNTDSVSKSESDWVVKHEVSFSSQAAGLQGRVEFTLSKKLAKASAPRVSEAESAQDAPLSPRKQSDAGSVPTAERSFASVVRGEADELSAKMNGLGLRSVDEQGDSPSDSVEPSPRDASVGLRSAVQDVVPAVSADSLRSPLDIACSPGSVARFNMCNSSNSGGDFFEAAISVSALVDDFGVDVDESAMDSDAGIVAPGGPSFIDARGPLLSPPPPPGFPSGLGFGATGGVALYSSDIWKCAPPAAVLSTSPRASHSPPSPQAPRAEPRTPPRARPASQAVAAPSSVAPPDALLPSPAPPEHHTQVASHMQSPPPAHNSGPGLLAPPTFGAHPGALYAQQFVPPQPPSPQQQPFPGQFAQQPHYAPYSHQFGGAYVQSQPMMPYFHGHGPQPYFSNPYQQDFQPQYGYGPYQSQQPPMMPVLSHSQYRRM
eukprot:TRINITY_DN7515_c0_g1_i1.p1 TRINITY_DN7515_c0_g1~~TRINITY_DN7515_c0_g1_i1.p1  ORF type:complete len:1248 (-),score=292.60 TRINITY_DN7515_c0_g1_i1:55-3798(-)